MILQVTINGFGSTVVAAYTAASKVEQLTTQPTFTFGLAAATFTAQNAGAGKLDRVKDGGYELSAWYDRSEKDGGRIRVIVAK